MSIKQSVSIVAAAIIGGVIGASLVLSEVRAQDLSAIVRSPKTLTANAIDLVDGNGHIKCKISAESGSPICFFYGPVGKVRMRIGLGDAAEDYAPFISMRDKDMQERLGIGLGKDRENRFTSYLRLRDSRGRGRLSAAYQEGFGPSYSLLDDSGAMRGSLVQFDDKQQDAGLLLAKPASNETAQLLISEFGPSIGLASGKASLIEGVNPKLGTNIFLSNNEGNTRMRLSVDPSGSTSIWRYGKGIYGYIDKQVERDFKKQAESIPKVEEVNLYGYPPAEQKQ